MSILSTGTTSGTACSLTADTTGDCIIKTGSSATTAMTISGSTQAVTLAGSLVLGSSTLAAPSGSAPSYTCRAWVNFNGTGTPAIRESGNVSSITDNGTGNWTVNFTTAMPDANYAVAGVPGWSNNYLLVNVNNATPNTTGACTVSVRDAATNSSEDVSMVHVVIFR